MADAMTTRPLGDPELRVSVVGLGCNNFGRKGFATEDLKGTDAVIGACLDHGITLLDTAAMYGGPESMSEQLMGRALKGRRDQVVLATKFGHEAGGPVGESEWGPRGSRAYVRKAVEGSLRRLQTDWIDLYQQHTPDPHTPVEETLEALSELVTEGKVRYVGSSNVTAEMVVEADDAAKTKGLHRFVSVQNEYSLLHREPEAELLPVLAERSIGLLPYFPLASGLLTGKYRKGEAAPAGTRLAANQQRFDAVTDRQWDQVEAYRALCQRRGVSMLEATFAWLLAQREVASVIAGATTADQVAANARAGHARVDDDTLAQISEIFSPVR